MSARWASSAPVRPIWLLFIRMRALRLGSRWRPIGWSKTASSIPAVTVRSILDSRFTGQYTHGGGEGEIG